MNRVILIGRLTKDPDLRRIPSGTAVVSFTIAVDNFGRDQHGERRPASFIPCTVFNKQAENLARFTKKGSNICVEGRLNQREYSRKDGSQAQVVEVIVDNVQFLDSRRDGESVTRDIPPAVDLDQPAGDALGFDDDDDNAPSSNIEEDDDLPF